MKPRLILDSPGRRSERQLSDFFEENARDSQKLQIAVGYASEESLQLLIKLAAECPHLHIDLTLGMHAREGITARQLAAATELQQVLASTGRGDVFVTPRNAFHGKIYLFETGSGLVAYLGSANLSSIVPGYFKSLEAGIVFSNEADDLQRYLEDVIVPIRESIASADIPINNAPTSPMRNVDEAMPVDSSDLVQIFKSPISHRFSLPLKAEKASNLNAHLGGGGKRSNAYGGITRDWYEGELIVSSRITSQPGYPGAGAPFDVVTEDGWKFEAKVSGQNKKNLRSAGRLSTFGTWLKSRFAEAGVLKFGDVATPEHIELLGKPYLTIEFRPEYGLWTFSLTENSV